MLWLPSFFFFFFTRHVLRGNERSLGMDGELHEILLPITKGFKEVRASTT